MANRNGAIGVFDSGIGGLTVFKAVREMLPNESIIYLGDTARVPYGIKSADTIIKYSVENARFLLERGVKVIVVACNTSSAYAIPAISAVNGVPVIGVIEPGVDVARAATRNKKIGVIGTASTILSNKYAEGLKKEIKDVKVVSMPCPLFVPLVEEGWTDNDVAHLVAEKYLSELKPEGIDSLILGCTHYPLLKDTIQRVVGEGVALVDSAEALVYSLKNLLFKENLINEGAKKSDYHIYVTDLPNRFELIANRFLDGRLPVVKRVEL